MGTSSSRIEQYRKSYQLHLARLTEQLGDKDKAVESAVGGDFEVFGQIEFDLLVSLGLRPEHSVIDVGCGCGRLAHSLREYTRAKYTGIDIIPELVSYAGEKAARADWDFLVGDGAGIPDGVAKADCVCLFSLLTHLSLEDGYRYLSQAAKHLNPSGILVFSFLDFTMPDHWPHFMASLASADEDRVAVQYLSRDTVASWASRLGLEFCAVLDSDRLEIPISKPLRWRNGNVTTGMISLGQSVAVLSLGPSPIPPSALRALGASEHAAHTGSYRKILEAALGKARDEARQALVNSDVKARQANQESREYVDRLTREIEALHRRMKVLESDWAVARGRAAALGGSWLPGRFHLGRLAEDEFFRAETFGDNGADLHGVPITYHLYTSPYRIFAAGRNTLEGWCYAANETISGVRVRLNESEYPAIYPIDTARMARANLDAFAQSRGDGFSVEFGVPPGERHFLRIEANVAGKGWSTFVSCPIWTS